MTRSLESVKQMLVDNETGRYGIFGAIRSSGYFPPHEFLNEFLLSGSDPCDQDGWLPRWRPIALSVDEYEEIKAWWVARHVGAIEDRLGAACWDDWVQEMLNR